MIKNLRKMISKFVDEARERKREKENLIKLII